MWLWKSRSLSGSVIRLRCSKKLQPFGQLHESLALFRGQPGGDEVLYPPRLIQQGDDAVARPGQRAGGVQHPLEHRVKVEALIDAQAGLAELGEAVAQLRYLPRLIVCLFHIPSLKRAAYDRFAARRRRAGCGIGRTRSARPAPIIAGPGKTHNRFGPKRLDSHSYLTDVLVKCGRMAAHFVGGTRMAFDRPVDGIETATAPAARVAAFRCRRAPMSSLSS